MDVLLAIICGILYFLAKSKIGYTLTTALGSGIFIGFILGLYFNDLASGLIIGASIQLIYLGVIHTGGNEPSDGELASIIAIPIALQTGLDASAAVALAVPFGVLGIFLDQIRRTSNSIWVRKADRYAAEGNEKGIARCAFLYPAVFAFILRFVPVFIITLFGSSAVATLMDVLPQWVINGFSVAGGILPAMGFAIIIITIRKPKLLPYFFIGFFAVAYLGINTMAAAAFGTCIALLVIFNERSKTKEEA